MDIKHYAERDIEAQGVAYIRHIRHMTSEGLWSKSDIAAELAHRDNRIKELKDLLKYFMTADANSPDFDNKMSLALTLTED